MTSKRMSLVEGMRRDDDELDPATVDSFVKHGTVSEATEPKLTASVGDVAPKPTHARQDSRDASARPTSAAMTPGLIPVNVRVRPEIATALKTASLQRELQGIEPHSKRGIVEQALEPWLKRNGFL
jgi:hypothetical protein